MLACLLGALLGHLASIHPEYDLPLEIIGSMVVVAGARVWFRDRKLSESQSRQL